MTQVYLYQNGQRTGPFEVPTLQASLQSAQLTATDPAWFEGCTDWVTLADVPGIILPDGGQGKPIMEKAPFEAYEGEEPFVFVSYSHQDAHLVYPEIRQIRSAGYNIWYDEGVAASNEWPEEIANAVLGCSVFLGFLTPRAVDSVNCRNEINLALNEKKPFLSIHLEETELPPGLRLRMGDLQAIVKARIPPERYFRKVCEALDQLLGRKTKANLGAVEKASSLTIARNGQTFGPYTYQQASQYLQLGQLLSSDYALLEGQTEWKFLPDALNALKEGALRHKQAEMADVVVAQPTGSGVEVRAKKTLSKSVKIRGMNTRGSTIKVREKGLLSKLIATCVVFFVTFLVVAGSTLGAYLIAPSQVGPVVRKFGLPIDQWFPGREIENVEIVEAPPGRLQDIRIGKEQWHHINSSGIKLLPIEGEVGLQVISPIDQKLAMNDDDLKVLLLIAQHLVILDLTKSEVSDDGLATLKKFPNLKKLTLEGSEKITSAGIRHLSEIISLENLNLVRVKLDDSAVDALSAMKGLREVYLYNSNLSDEAIEKLKSARPQVFVNAG